MRQVADSWAPSSELWFPQAAGMTFIVPDSPHVNRAQGGCGTGLLETATWDGCEGLLRTCNQVTARFCGGGYFERTLLFLITFGVYPWYGKKAKDTCHAQSATRGAPWTSRERPTSCDSQFHRF